MAKRLMKGAEAIGEAAVRAGAEAYFCYPITPQTEVAEYLARRMPEAGGVFLQAESEVAAVNMIFGAAGAGARVFTSSSSPGISLMAEGMSYLAGAELPAVLINIMRAGPGLGGILPSQSDYFQATKGGGHGDYHYLVLAPSTIQETVDLTFDAFALAEKYRNPVMLVGDGLIGQMMEPVDFEGREAPALADVSGWATTGCEGRDPHIVKSLFLDPLKLEEHNHKLHAKYQAMRRDEVRFERYFADDEDAPELLMVAYGTTARVVRTAVDILREEGVRAGLFRPVTLFPFAEKELEALSDQAAVKDILTVEMSMGQMSEDVARVTRRAKPLHFFSRVGGIIPTPGEVVAKAHEILAGKSKGE